MTKLTRLSLVAAVAVAGLTNVNAASLEEAIKGVNVSGTVYAETVNTTVKNGSTATVNDIDVDITFKSKVNDNITAVVKVQADVEDGKTALTQATQQPVTVDNVYFAYANGPLAINAGKVNIATPSTDGERATGILASYNTGSVALNGAHYSNNSKTDAAITAISALGTVGPVNAELWYVGIAGASENTTVALSTKVGSVALKARHAMTSFDDAAKEDGATTRIDASTSVAGIALSATYLTTDKDNAAYTTTTASANTFELSQLGVSNTADVDLYAVGASYTMNDLTYAVNYASYDEGTAGEADELRLKTTYKMSKNFAISGTYSMYEGTGLTDNDKNTEKDSARLDAKYTF